MITTLPGQPSQILATSVLPRQKSSDLGTAFSGTRYFCVVHTQMFRSRDSLLRFSLLLCSPDRNLPLQGQLSQDFATSKSTYTNLPLPKQSSKGPFDDPHAQIIRSRDSLLRNSLLVCPSYTDHPLPGQSSQDLASSLTCAVAQICQAWRILLTAFDVFDLLQFKFVRPDIFDYFQQLVSSLKEGHVSIVPQGQKITPKDKHDSGRPAITLQYDFPSFFLPAWHRSLVPQWGFA